MNVDARISVSLPTHPKTKKLIRRGGQGAAWNLVCLFLWVSQNKPSGQLDGMTDEDIEIAAGWEGDDGKFVATLSEVRFLDGDAGSRSIHDWEAHNPWAAGATRRSQKSSAAAATKWGIPESTNKQTRSERLAEARKLGTHTAAEWTAMVDIFDSKCVRCDESGEIVKDHIVPIYKGGSDSISNLQPLCRRCNSSKGPETADFREKRVPDYLERLRNACQTPADACPNVSPASVSVSDTESTTETKQHLSAPPTDRRVDSVKLVFDHWRIVMGHPQAKLGDSGSKRYRAIAGRLKDGYTPEQLKTAIDGCKKSPHHMGKNDRHEVYDDLELICRDQGHVDKFLALGTGMRVPIASTNGSRLVTPAAGTEYGGL